MARQSMRGSPNLMGRKGDTLMATIVKEINLKARSAKVWDALKDFQAVHKKVAPGFLTDSKPDGEDARIVFFANGTQARELLVSADDEKHRLVYAILGNERLKHYNASAQVFANGDQSRFVWTVDVLPSEMAPYISGQMDEGLKHMKPALERA
jgi:hypothetical protein